MIVSDSCAAHNMAGEALACFTSLLENVPGWIADLESILKSASENQEEIVYTQQPPSTPTPSSNVLPRVKSSLKSKVSKASLREAVNRANAWLQPQKKKHITQSDALRLSQRKRKTASVYSGGEQSGPAKFRNKAASVVFYDGDTQKRFEKLVRAVGSSRNAIRKGKMSAKVDALARTGSSSSESSNSSGEDTDFTPRLHYKSARPDRLPTLGSPDHIAVFDRVDGQLEKAQALCERAAHQILRDGDCTLETTNAKEHFADALRMVEAELPALQKKAERAAERRKKSEAREERRRAEEEAAEERRKSAAAMAEKIISAVAAAQSQPSAQTKLEPDALEVDEASESDDEEFDISAIQLSKFARVRPTRLPAAAAAH